MHTSFRHNTYLPLQRTNRGSCFAFQPSNVSGGFICQSNVISHFHALQEWFSCRNMKRGHFQREKKWMENVTYSKCPWAAAAHKGVKPFLSAASTWASAFSSNRAQSVGFEQKVAVILHLVLWWAKFSVSCGEILTARGPLHCTVDLTAMSCWMWHVMNFQKESHPFSWRHVISKVTKTQF